MSKKIETSESARKLVNKLTVEDARHLLRNQGGELTPRELVFQTVRCFFAIEKSIPPQRQPSVDIETQSPARTGGQV